ncbi:YesN/AraC family two-component response regulator [Paenibacillus phyllosphaerae]|uniref:YesN/AraC family two-component response regulator n=1 Tax=Paenibacillus phyllosphaerae TaxID=274593 RepID=A0A7W5B0R6_9BACL|nr:response regulator [Paenibacillus phyllosphaerae]MBB3112278.1 YesN/AraC family two-component response regulator [Paenibacillus phyllosphaerae]
MKTSTTILIVDDEPRTRQGLKKTLETWADSSCEIMTAENGDEALELAASRPIHLLLTDIRMPEMNGLELIQAIKKQGSEPVVILLSGYSEFEYAQEGIRLGVVNYLLKPVTKTKLLEAVEEALRVSEGRRRMGAMEKIVDKQLIEMKEEDRLVPQPVQEAIRFIEANVKAPLSLREVAEHVHLNASYFSSLFKEKTGMTFSEFVARSKMQAAKKLLYSTGLPIADVAEEVGYQTAKYFITLFKEYEGITPSQYRKNLSEGDNI